MSKFAHIAQRLFNTPLMLREAKIEMLVAALGERLGVANLDRMDGSAMTIVEMNAMASEGRSRGKRDYKPYEIVDDVAWVSIEGTLLHKYGYLDPVSGCTGYDGIIAKIREASDDSDVKAIWLDFNSPGGEVYGCFETAKEIAARNKAAGGKPIWAMVNEECCSAAYALASACDKIFIPETGVTASIGAYIAYVDWSESLTKEGINVTIIRSGERKGRNTGMEPLDDKQFDKLQASVVKTRDLFAKLVAANRNLSMKAVVDTQSDWFDADDALRFKLVDGVMSEVEAFAKLQRSLARAA